MKKKKGRYYTTIRGFVEKYQKGESGLQDLLYSISNYSRTSIRYGWQIGVFNDKIAEVFKDLKNENNT